MMKKITFLAITAAFAILFVNQKAEAQVKDNVIKANIFGPILGQYQLAYERAFNEHVSAQLSAGLISRNVDITVTSGTSTSTSESNTSGFIVIPELRYYFSEAPKDFYASAFFRYRTATNTISYTNSNNQDASTDYTRSAVGGGVLIGYQVLISDAVALDFQIGPQYKAVSNSVSNEDPNTIIDVDGESDGIGVRFAFFFGYAF